MDKNSLEKKFNEEYQKYKEQIKKPNILIAGATGAGKSSLINCIFGENIANVDAGKPVTRGINKYEKEELDVILFDSEGYEVGDEKQSRFREQVIDFIDKNENNLDKQIHLVWYCISAANHRITDLDKKIIQEIRNKKKSIGVVFTQCDSVTKEEIEELEAIIEEIGVKSFRVTTIEYEGLGYLDLEKLISWSMNQLTDSDLKRAFIRSQILNLELKKKEVKKIIKQHTAGSAFVGFSPIPFSDAPILLTNQGGMIARILYVYDLEDLGTKIPTLVSSIGIGSIISSFGIQAVAYLGAQLLKLIPGLGTVSGGAINATVASTITAAIGFSISEIAYKIVKLSLNGEIDNIFDFIEKNKSLFEEIFKNKLKDLI